MTEIGTGPSGRPSTLWILGSLVIAAILASIVLCRPYDGAQFHSARNGVEWTHHTLRVQMADELPGFNPARQLDWLIGADRDFPPLVPAIAALAGFVTGHDEASIHRFGLLWSLLLALATMLVLHRLYGKPQLSLAGGVACFLLPAHHAAALNFYFDLPMAALLWCSLAALLWLQDTRPVLAGLVAGSFLFLACIAKWTALPIAGPMLLGALATRSGEQPWNREFLLHRLRVAVPLALFSAGLVLSFWRLSPRSWNRMLSMSFGSSLDPSTEFGTVGWLHTIQTTLGGLFDAVTLGRHMSLEALLWYPLHFLFCFLSIPIAVLLAVAAARWLRRPDRAMPLVVSAVAGHLVLIYAVFSSLDERFLLTLGPALLLPPLLGWWGLKPMLRASVAGLFVVTSLWVAWDFHHSTSEAQLNAGFDQPEPTGTAGRVWHEISSERRGIGLQSSTDRQWGWMRSDALRPAYFKSRELVWQQLLECGAKVVLAQEELTLDGFGEGFWWEFRNRLAGLEGEASPESIIGFSEGATALLSGQATGVLRAVESDRIVAVTRYSEGLSWSQLALPDDLKQAVPWTLRAKIDRTALHSSGPVLMDGPAKLALWTPAGSSLCVQFGAQSDGPASLP